MIKMNKGRAVLNFVLAIFLFSILSCESNKRDEINIDDLPDPVSFSEHIVPIFKANCTACHNGTTPPDLTAENGYLDLVGGGYINVEDPVNSKLYKSIDLGGNMYQYASDLDRAYILKWIESGADDN